MRGRRGAGEGQDSAGLPQEGAGEGAGEGASNGTRAREEKEGMGDPHDGLLVDGDGAGHVGGEEVHLDQG